MRISKIKSFLFKNEGVRQTVAKNTFWLTFGQIFSRVIKAVLMIYAARLLGTAGYGTFSYALSLAALFTMLSDVGIGGLLTREVSVTKEVERYHFATSLFIKLLLISAGSLLVIFIAPFFTKIPEALPLLPIIVFLLAFDSLRDFLLAITRAQEKMQVEAGVLVFTNITIVALGIVSLFIFGSARSLMVAYTIGSGAGFLVTFLILRKYLSKTWRYVDRKLIKRIFSDAWPFALLGLLGIVMMNTDVIMLGWIRGAGEVGLYSAAQKIVQIIYVIPIIVGLALFPVMARLANKKDRKLRKIMEETIASTLMIGLPIMTGGIVLGRSIINLLFGVEYVGATLAFQILLPTILIIFPATIIAYAVFAYNKQRNFIGLLLFGTVANVILNIALIPKYGIEGSAVATIGAQLVANTFIWIKMKKINYFSVLPHIKKIILATSTMTILTFIIQLIGINVAVNMLISILVYFVTLNLLKEPLLKQLTRRRQRL